MIAAIMMALNEADIIEYNLRHLYAEGVDQVWIVHGPSEDRTGELIQPERWADGFLVVIEDHMPYHAQPMWMGELAYRAGESGAEWILPIDCDEFWYACDGTSIAETLNALPPVVRSVSVPMIRHLDWNRRMEMTTLPKVGFRYEPGVEIANGNHACSVRGEKRDGVLALRELHYRGLTHFMRKTRERNALIDPSLGGGEGAHQRQYAGMTDDELRDAWKVYRSAEQWTDPVPSRLTTHPHWMD